MTARVYGRIRLTEEELRIVRRMLARGIETVTSNLAAASQDDEKAYYKSTMSRYEQELARFAKVKPGPVAFTEDDLLFVRGSIFPILQPELLSRWAAKHELDDREVAALSAEIDEIEVLERKFAQPFLRDRSQDAAPDNEEEADDPSPFA